MLQTIRLDSDDVKKSTAILKRYAKKHPGTKFLLSQEGTTPEDGVKYHQQGWAYHFETQKSFSQYISREFPNNGGSKKSLAVMDKPPSYIPYIIHNSNKRPVEYSSLVTNYTQEEFKELLKKYKWIERRPNKLKKGKRKQEYSDYILDSLSEEAVVDGIIQYEKVMTVFVNHYQTTKVGTSVRRMKEVLDGYLWRLENKYPKNSRMHFNYYNAMCRMDDDVGIYKNYENYYLKLEMYNKNADETEAPHYSQEEADHHQEELGEDSQSDCEEDSES